MNSQALEKIKKLLRLGQSSNQHEAELAMERAFELANRHSIDLTSIDLSDEERKILHKFVKCGQRISTIRRLALLTVNCFFNVKVIFGDPVTFIGTESNVEIAIYVYEFLARACSDSVAAYSAAQPRKLAKTKRRGFIQGFFYGIDDKLHASAVTLELEEVKTALVLRTEKDRRDQYAQENFKLRPYKVTERRPDKSAILIGFEQGQTVNISKGLTAANLTPKLLTA